MLHQSLDLIFSPRSILKQRLNLIFLLSLIFTSLFSQNEVKFDVQEIPGGKYKIGWNTPENSKVYISFIGYQENIGEIIVDPEFETEYSLITEKDGEMFIDSKTIEAGGARGDDFCPKTSMYTHYQYRYKVLKKVQVVDLLDAIRTILQDEMNFSVLEDHFNSISGQYFFQTNCSQRNYLLSPEDTDLSGRKIAYKLDIILPNIDDEKIVYQITSAILYKKKVVRTWRIDDEEYIHSREAKRFKEKLDSYLASKYK